MHCIRAAAPRGSRARCVRARPAGLWPQGLKSCLLVAARLPRGVPRETAVKARRPTPHAAPRAPAAAQKPGPKPYCCSRRDCCCALLWRQAIYAIQLSASHSIQTRRRPSAAPCCGVPANPNPLPGYSRALSPTSLGAANFTPQARPEKVLTCPTSSQDPGRAEKLLGQVPTLHHTRAPRALPIRPPTHTAWVARTSSWKHAYQETASALEVRPVSLHTLHSCFAISRPQAQAPGSRCAAETPGRSAASGPEWPCMGRPAPYPGYKRTPGTGASGGAPREAPSGHAP